MRHGFDASCGVALFVFAIGLGAFPNLASACCDPNLLRSSPLLVGVSSVPAVAEIEQPYRRSTRGLLQGFRKWLRRVLLTIWASAVTWLHWISRALVFASAALAIAVFDGRLMGAWRREGLSVLRHDVPLMVYVTFALLADRSVPNVARMLLAYAVLLGVVRADAIPDRSVFPGLVDDAILIYLAVRTWQACCPPDATARAAERALAWQRRTTGLRRSGGRWGEPQP